MKINFSERANGLKASEIRELLKLTEMPEVISFAGGLPAPELFPVDGMKKVTQEVLEKDGQVALQYSTTEGFKPLRDIIAKQRMSREGVDVTGDDIIVTSGSQEGIEFSAKIFVNEGDTIICESPSYLGAIGAFKAYRPNFTEIEMDEHGIIIEKLEEELKKNKKVKMIYTIPDFQNPTGITMSDDRRKRIAELAKEYQVPVIEDNPYGELIFEGTTHPSIKSFDKDGWVIYLGTFSKTFCPGLRLGWICAAPEILEKYIIIKQGVDLQCSTLDQRAAALFMQKYDLNEHVEEIKKVYGKRRKLMLESMDKYFPKEVKHTNPYGGLFTWVYLKEGLDSAEILKEALKENVAYVPGGPFFPNGGHKNHFRLNYSCMSEDKIVEGIKRLGKVLAKYY
ncbi:MULTISPECIES: PLP-dependent aminotransferase family protein [Clostridium]|uniref:2-aminoadipate transaminase n=3 Tax=Clostridium TaxID=1485 RepID=D8GJM6_CLOLD|nr:MULTISPECIES: PLP-dependent aminotransferase family protein [Clostridium]ADK15187.1 predicted Aminotransferase, class I and II family [Clostridium ljungdahlii DSM 13528]AGY74446.1 PLP-dependent aminotransferase family protein [Clostridium autoethanogenum DSM 10061]ALU34634.1 putative transcriptional regulator GntR family [Clostridium autoethanogenum DSM 10061]OAA88667.1 2-aminoadipate transaminase [Clostridium ljungdahlii DSM 13528]OVY51354.1 2-aminoadipate transaminase [Clostridium autoeth